MSGLVRTVTLEMPPAKRSKTTRRITKSRYNKRAPTYRTNRISRTWPYASTGMGLRFDPFPVQHTALLRYSTTITLSPSVGLTDSYLFRANSIFDPDFTGVGHQPYGYDTYAQIYNHYEVVSATIIVTPTVATSGILGIAIDDDSTVEINYDTVREQKGTRILAMAGQSTASQKLSNYFNVNQIFDLPYQKATSSAFGQSPSESTIFHVFFENATDSGTGNTFKGMVNIVYKVRMWELKNLGQS